MELEREPPAEAATARRWAVAWALAAAAVIGSGGGDWTQGPAWRAALGIAVACAALLYGGAGMARGSGARHWAAIAAWPAGFLLAVGLLFTGALGESLIELLAAAGLVGCLGGASSAAARRERAVDILGMGLLWALAFALGALVTILAGYVLGELLKRALQPLLGWWPGLVLGHALAGALGGVLAGGIGAFLGTRPAELSVAGRHRGAAG